LSFHYIRHLKAADENNAAALNNLGNMHRSGDGVAQNHEQAAHYYKRAAKLGISAFSSFNTKEMRALW
jgi:TPR repeat protein